MCAWLRTTASRCRRSASRCSQFRSRSSFNPWNRPQSSRTQPWPVVTRCIDPVTVPAAPRNWMVATLLRVFTLACSSPHTACAILGPHALQGGTMIKTNMGGVDTAIRAVVGSLAIVLAGLVADQYPVVALATGVVATVAIATAIAGVCPLYPALGLDTRA